MAKDTVLNESAALMIGATTELTTAAPKVARDEKAQAKIDGFLNEFASNDNRRARLQKMFDDGLSGEEAADEFKAANRAYFIKRFNETAKA